MMTELNERIMNLENKIMGDDLDVSAIRDQLLELTKIVADLISFNIWGRENAK